MRNPFKRQKADLTWTSGRSAKLDYGDETFDEADALDVEQMREMRRLAVARMKELGKNGTRSPRLRYGDERQECELVRAERRQADEREAA